MQSGSEDLGGMPHVNVLLIEDNPGDARLIREMLADSKGAVFSIELADRLSTGLAHLAGGNGDFDVVLLDLSLPDSSGIDTFVRTGAQAQNMPIVVLTGLYDTELAILAVQKGAQDYLVKGQVNSEIMARAIRYAIERNRAEAHIKHLNSVLKAIRNVNQLIVTETERDSLLRKSCDALVDARGYDAVWLGYLDDGEKFATVVGSGFPDDVSRLRRHVLDGDYPPCIRDALAMKETVHARNKLRECGDCFFDGACLGKEAVIARVEHAYRFYGLLVVLLAPGVAVDDEENRLLSEVASDIGIAFHNREVKEARGKAEDALKESDARLRLVVENMPVMLDAFDDKGNIVTWNSECEKVTGFNSREIINNPGAAKILYPDQDYENYIHSTIGEYGGNFRNLEWGITCKDGSVKTILWSNISEKYPIPGWHSWAIGFDITERRKAEELIKRSLQEKEVLLREIHHRVKNNLQVVSSLLNMQARVASDPDTVNALLESYDRINAMALIHTQLYESVNLSAINMNNFVGRLMGQLFRSRQVDGARIMYATHITDQPLPISIALPMGLVINELLTNALKHAFREGCAGTVEVMLIIADGGDDTSTVRLTVRDNGVGVPEGFNINEGKTLGLRLVKILVEDQLQGTLDVIRDRGTTFDIEFGIGK
ncbi:MAG: histidine kinase dimerization/phosphoacceptor domain -containing protein [Euryarchaeota archaeon]|nr:histidine kinase dimerization/phosphoacceptor domain -containing protein [Euryarchaeota archaeon]